MFGSSVLIKLKGKLIRFCSSFLYVAVFLPFFFLDSDEKSQQALYLVVIAILSLIWAFILYRRIHLIEDTAPTQLSSAAQGYAELEGKVHLYEKEITRGPDRELPVMAWHAKLLDTSTAGFILKDEKGQCTIDPRDAEVITPNYRYNDQSYNAIYPGEMIYVLGYLETLNKHRTEYERKGLISKQFSEWKQNRFSFMDMFDKNHDNIVDEYEMEIARNTASNLIDRRLEEVYQMPATHVVSQPSDGRPFILSSIHPDKLLKTYKLSFFIHIFIWVYLSVIVLAMQAGYYI